MADAKKDKEKRRHSRSPSRSRRSSASREREERRKAKEAKKKEEELSEEDLQLKHEVDMCVVRLSDANMGVQKLALEMLRDMIRSSTASMTSVPKPLKFLRPHYGALKELFDKAAAGPNKTLMSDLLSVLAMTMGKPGARESLKYKLAGGTDFGDLTNWGHEYVRALSADIIDENAARKEAGEKVDDLSKLVAQIIPFNMKNNAEADAIDLLIEMDQLRDIVAHVQKDNRQRVVLYLTRMSDYLPSPDNSVLLDVAFTIEMEQKRFPEALRLALRMKKPELVKKVWDSCTNATAKKQLAMMLGSFGHHLETDDEQLQALINMDELSDHFLNLVKDLDVEEAKSPEDIYKSHLEHTRIGAAAADSAKQNLASTFVNAFVNAGFQKDTLMTEENSKWLYKNRDSGMMSAAASLGMILLWDVNGALPQIDKFLYSDDDFVKAGGLLAIGIVNSSVRNEFDPALNLLPEHVEGTNNSMKIGAICGLGIAYAGTHREDVRAVLMPMLDEGVSMEIAALASLALGMVYVGTGDGDVVEAVTQALLERDASQFDDTFSRFMCLGLGLVFLGTEDAAEVTVETLKVMEGPMAQYAQVTVESMAYAGTGNVLKVQAMLSHCTDHLEEKNAHQAVAVLGLALISSAEDIGKAMALRSYDHLLQYGEPVIRRAVPLAMALSSLCQPDPGLTDKISKLSHDTDSEVSMSAILALGLIGAGTNNARIAQLLRGLASYYSKEPNNLFVVRIAQGLLHLGKGTMTLLPTQADGHIVNNVATASLAVLMHCFLDVKNTVLAKGHYLLWYLVGAMRPRMLMTFDENLKPLAVPVRVGQAVDTVGQAGRPKTITGAQTHNTPVLIGANERAELATEEYVAVSEVLSDLVILKKNPEYVA